VCHGISSTTSVSPCFQYQGSASIITGRRPRDSVWRYMAGVASNLHGQALRVGGYYDHVHLLLHIPAKIAVADFARQLKASISKHTNEERALHLKFHWQYGYAAFTVSRSKVDSVLAYMPASWSTIELIMKLNMTQSTIGSSSINVSPAGLLHSEANVRWFTPPAEKCRPLG
jgi:REP element-mobilizing transposase RayT